MKNSLVFLLFICISNHTFCSEVIRIIIKTNRPLESVSSSSRENVVTYDFTRISEIHNLYTIQLSTENQKEVISQLSKDKNILFWKYDTPLEQRNQPNDPLLDDQWHIDFLNLRDIWTFGTGGIHNDQHKIVVAVLEVGIDIAHDDLKENIFVNEMEIPNDFIDNDGNGYIDDYNGWDANNRHGRNLKKEIHGTQVSGVIGAKGNNNLGISGINWDINILPIVGVSHESSIISAYEYIYNQRKLYNETNGEKGAFIVCSNLSLGLPFTKPTDNPIYKLWCDYYDLLGSVGILSITATDNRSNDVEEVGDMPSNCTSPYQIVATNATFGGEYYTSAAFGRQSVDIAAPGVNILTLETNNQYGQITGTSFSAPMISGVIGLLYSLPCDHFSKIVTDSPAQATLQLKNLIIKSAVKHPSYENITTTEGYFDAREASRYFSTLCEGQLMVPSSKGRLSFKNLEFHSNSISFDFATPYRGDHIIQLINYDGKILFEQKMLPVDFGVNLISVPFNIEIHIPLILSISSKFERINYHFRKY